MLFAVSFRHCAAGREVLAGTFYVNISSLRMLCRWLAGLFGLQVQRLFLGFVPLPLRREAAVIKKHSLPPLAKERMSSCLQNW